MHSASHGNSLIYTLNVNVLRLIINIHCLHQKCEHLHIQYKLCFDLLFIYLGNVTVGGRLRLLDIKVFFD